MKKALKILLIITALIILLIVIAVVVFIAIASHRNTHYYENATPYGEVEKKYTALGSYDVSYAEFDADDTLKKYKIWYPSEMESENKSYPLVIMANGTGIKASQYKEVFRHLASWGFIVAGNEDEQSRTGKSSADTLSFMLSQNNGDGIFCGKIDTANIGIAGHSQGGVGAINAVTAQDNGGMYKAMWTASATSSYWGQEDVFGTSWSYDVSKISIPYFMVAGTGYADSGTAEDITAREGQGICPLWSLKENYNAVPDDVPKVMARLIDKDHGDMLRYADGYMTAWFTYWLMDDTETSMAFFGDNAEILKNNNWQDIAINGE